jgi:diaminopimelate decarboxylase
VSDPINSTGVPGSSPPVLVDSPWPRTASFSDRRLQAVGGVAVADLAKRFGTPLYVLDRHELLGRMRAYREALGPQVAVVYAAKALCVTGVLQLAAREGLWIDVASGGELATALRAQVPAERIVFHGNNKSPHELRTAADVGVGRLVADSFAELERIAELGRSRGRDLPVVVRVTPGVEAHTHEFIATGQDDSKFGFTLSAGLAHQAVERALALDGVALRGVHAHVGSQVLTLAAFERSAELLIGLLADVRDRTGVTLPELNLGGGLGIPHLPGEEEVPLERYAATIRRAVDAACAAADLPVPALAVEPGRSIAGPAGLTLYTVGTVKHVPGVRTYVSVDGGMSDNPRPALYGARYSFAAAGEGNGAPLRTVSVVGKHCESGDVLGRDVELPADLAEGALLAVATTGAYNHAMASNYNRLPRPAMVLVGDGDARLLVRRETLDDVLARDLVL